MNKRLTGVIKKLAIVAIGTTITISLMGASAFYILIVSGIFPDCTDLWVNTAMHTLNNQWLATSFFSQETIDEILERTTVDDSQYSTDVSLVLNSPAWGDSLTCIDDLGSYYNLGESEEVVEISKDEQYLSEGYSKKSDGVYFKEVSGTSWKGYLLLVEDPSRVSLAQTSRQWNRGDLVKTMVNNNGALYGINGGGFDDGPNYDSNGGNPTGLLIVDGEVICSNGNAKHSMIGFNSDNVLVLSKVTKQEALDADIRDCVEFKPFLIVNGETVIKDGTGGWGIAPRTAIGQRATGEIIFLCVDGRQTHSIGCDLRPLQDTLFDEGCVNAAMLDGGSSTVMYSAEEGYLNQPSLGHERYINNAWIIK